MLGAAHQLEAQSTNCAAAHLRYVPGGTGAAQRMGSALARMALARKFPIRFRYAQVPLLITNYVDDY